MPRTNLLVQKDAIPADTSRVWIEDRYYKVTRLPISHRAEELILKSQNKDPYEKIRKQGPTQQRRTITNLLKKEKEEALREVLGIIKLTGKLKKEHEEDLLVTEGEIASKLQEINS